ncbi:uncharacterized protein LOC108235487 [Kryptolebias marmoratus]|uniref:uncharacterized protein LOC108235487 n=1 Tax=Kryptolebias marmoratus TaxID=37003 RepID=UPI0007F88C15|nr:uncharacterized protein LOC108235487 [Kryptolebias marmoratus]
MKLLVTVQKCVYLWCFLSIAVLHSVSAGGAYCAKTARARAAALGLEYPGVHGAPDLSAPAHHVMHPRTYSSGTFAEPNRDSHRYNQPRGSPYDDMMYEQVQPRSSDGFLLSRGTSVPHGHNSFPRGLSVRTPESNFEEVKYAAPSQLGPMTLNPRSHTNLLPFVYSKHDLGVDESAPNGRYAPLSEFPVPQSWGHSTYNSPTWNTPRRDSPVFYSSRLFSKDRVRNRAPVYGRRKMIWFPGQLGSQPPKVLNTKLFVPGKTVLKNTRPDFKIVP